VRRVELFETLVDEPEDLIAAQFLDSDLTSAGYNVFRLNFTLQGPLQARNDSIEVELTQVAFLLNDEEMIVVNPDGDLIGESSDSRNHASIVLFQFLIISTFLEYRGNRIYLRVDLGTHFLLI